MAGLAECLEVADVVRTALMQRDDVVHFQIVLRVWLAAFEAGELIPAEDLHPSFSSAFSSLVWESAVCPRWDLTGDLDCFWACHRYRSKDQ